MRPNQLLLRCFAERKDGAWQAFCLDFDLAAQGESFDEVKAKLESMIAEYVYDALAGDDRDHAEQFLSRRAPFALWARFYLIKVRYALHLAQNGVKRLFTEPVPLVPVNPHHAG